MRILSLILALAFAMAGSSLAGPTDSRLPGIGTFSYHSPPATIVGASSRTIAAR